MDLPDGWRRWRDWLAEDPHPASHAEKTVSTLGALLGILGVMVVSFGLLEPHGAMLVVASMGSSAVLLFAVPHSPMSRPWPVVGGNVLSAAVGVSCVRLTGDVVSAAALAAALSVAAMYYTRCLHPPGGATALTAVLGGQGVHAMGYGFVLAPVLINVLVLLAAAWLYNACFPHRRYTPGTRRHRPATVHPLAGEKLVIAHSDLVYALSEIDSFIDISEEDLLEIYTLATRHAHVPDAGAAGAVPAGKAVGAAPARL